MEELSRLKCLDVAEVTEGDSVVIGADTVVAFEGEILGKPKGVRMQEDDETVAGEGASGVYWGYDCGESRNAKRVVTFCDCTDVEFYPMTEEEIKDYLALKKRETPVWSDKAGGYGIQTAFGTKFVKKGSRGTIIM